MARTKPVVEDNAGLAVLCNHIVNEKRLRINNKKPQLQANAIQGIYTQTIFNYNRTRRLAFSVLDVSPEDIDAFAADDKAGFM